MSEPRELRWVYRPAGVEPGAVPEVFGRGVPVHAVGAPDEDGRMPVVLVDGERVRASRQELTLE